VQIILQENENKMHFYYEFMNNIRFLCKNPDVFESRVMKRAACASLALVPEDVLIEFGVIATSRSLSS
jgi:hypothetical protein